MDTHSSYDYLFKVCASVSSSPPVIIETLATQILLVGNSGVGKSCILTRFTQDIFSDSMTSTIGRFEFNNQFDTQFQTPAKARPVFPNTV